MDYHNWTIESLTQKLGECALSVSGDRDDLIKRLEDNHVEYSATDANTAPVLSEKPQQHGEFEYHLRLVRERLEREKQQLALTRQKIIHEAKEERD